MYVCTVNIGQTNGVLVILSKHCTNRFLSEGYFVLVCKLSKCDFGWSIFNGSDGRIMELLNMSSCFAHRLGYA